MSTTKTPTRPPTHERPSVATRPAGPEPAPRSSRVWTLIAAVAVLAAAVAVLLWMDPGVDTASELSQADFATTARLEAEAAAARALQEQADFATTARLEAQAEQERALQEQADFATTARLEAQAEQERQARAQEAEGARWTAQAERYEELRRARSNAADTARLDGLAARELGR